LQSASSRYEWDACVADGGCNGYKPSDYGWGRGLRPAIGVSWDDANAYVAWLAKLTGKPYRLLSEAEYEYAARAGTTTIYPWGNTIGTNKANCNGCGSQWDNKQTAPVGSFAANGFGLFDMAGNVWELTQDCYQDGHFKAPTDGSAWTAGDCGRRVSAAVPCSTLRSTSAPRAAAGSPPITGATSWDSGSAARFLHLESLSLCRLLLLCGKDCPNPHCACKNYLAVLKYQMV
jgi:formylglycine-generating enzyme required for sulfatase activity